MRVSLVSSASGYPAIDALAHLASHLLRRGDSVQLFMTGAVDDLPQPLSEIAVGEDLTSSDLFDFPEFRSSDLYIYHYVSPHPVLNSLLLLNRGVVILWSQPSGMTHVSDYLEDPAPDRLVHLASASDLVVVDDSRDAQWMQNTGAAEPGRLHVVPPAVSLAEYTPGKPDIALQRDLDLLGKRVLLTVSTAHTLQEIRTLQPHLARIREQIPEAVLAIAPSSASDPSDLSVSSVFDDDAGIYTLPPSDDNIPYYRLADIYLTQPHDRTSWQHALEAMACGAPVLSIESATDPVAESAIQLLSNDLAYSESVRRSLNSAADHSLETFRQAWSTVLAEACGWLPVHLNADNPPASLMPVPATNDASSDPVIDRAVDESLGFTMAQLNAMASVTLRNYEVRSPTPVFGPFIAWVRRNLTSHLHKPYLDPTFDRQEAFNLRAAAALQELATRLAAYQQTTTSRPEREIRTELAPAYGPRDHQALQLIDQIENVITSTAEGETPLSQGEIDIILSALSQVRTLLLQQHLLQVHRADNPAFED